MCPRVRVQQFNQVTSYSPELRFQNSLYNWCRRGRFCSDAARHPLGSSSALSLSGGSSNGAAGAARLTCHHAEEDLSAREPPAWEKKKLLSYRRVQKRNIHRKSIFVFQGTATEAWIASFSKGSNLCYMRVPVESRCSSESQEAQYYLSCCEKPSAM